MIKFLFLDYRDYERVEGFTRALEPARRFEGNPVMRPTLPWEGNRLYLYGTVAFDPEREQFQLWYSAISQDGVRGCYAVSRDGIEWERPELDVVPWEEGRSNILFDVKVRPHGLAVLVDPADPRPTWRYKALFGASPSGRMSAFRSPDGIHWRPAHENPVIGQNPDCPISLLRQPDGRYVAFHRPGWADRRVARNESWDFIHWSEPRMIVEPGPGDPPQLQLYGLSAFHYGPLEMGLLWMYHTLEEDTRWSKGLGTTDQELVYSRSGTCWHRAALGTPFIPTGPAGSWEWGNIQVATTPVFLRDEIRFYYSANNFLHGEGKDPGQEQAIGFASIRPDRFVRLEAGPSAATLVTRVFWTRTPELYLNASILPGGAVWVEVLDADAQPIPGFSCAEAVPLEGDGTALRVAWTGAPDATKITRVPIRLRVTAQHARLYSLWLPNGDPDPFYHRFEHIGYVDPQSEMAEAGVALR